MGAKNGDVQDEKRRKALSDETQKRGKRVGHERKEWDAREKRVGDEGR